MDVLGVGGMDNLTKTSVHNRAMNVGVAVGLAFKSDGRLESVPLRAIVNFNIF